MKRTAIARPLLALALCLACLLCAACGGGEVGDWEGPDNSTPDAASLLFSFRDSIVSAGGAFAIRSISALQLDESAVSVELYSATDGHGVYQSTDFRTDGKTMHTSHAYTDGALRSAGTVIPMTGEEYRSAYGFPTLPTPDPARLTSLAVHRELGGGYCFTASESPEKAGEFLLGALGRELYALYAEAKKTNVLYTFHFRESGALDRLDIRTELTVNNATVFLTATVRYEQIGTARPVPPA